MDVLFSGILYWNCLLLATHWSHNKDQWGASLSSHATYFWNLSVNLLKIIYTFIYTCNLFWYLKLALGLSTILLLSRFKRGRMDWLYICCTYSVTSYHCSLLFPCISFIVFHTNFDNWVYMHILSSCLDAYSSYVPIYVGILFQSLKYVLRNDLQSLKTVLICLPNQFLHTQLLQK